MCQLCYTDDAGNPYVSVILQMMQVIPMFQSFYTDDAGNPHMSAMLHR